MSKSGEVKSKFPHVKGLAVKRTKFGQRYVLTEPDSSGKSRSITVKILDNDTVDVFYRKVSEARARLRSRNAGKSFAQLVDDYCIIRQLSENTKIGVKRSLSGFGFNDRENIRLVREIIGSQRRPGTKRVYLSHISGFYNWLSSHMEHVKNPCADVVIRGNMPHRSRTLTDEESERLIKYANSQEPRYRLFILLLINTGARYSTIACMRGSDLDDAGFLHLYNIKCKKPYEYPIPLKDDECVRLIREIGDDLWGGNEVRFHKALNGWMRYTFKKDSRGESLSTHSIRHTFATNALRNGVPLEVISKLLDHNNISTTLRVYAKLSDAQILDGLERATKKPT